MADRCEHCHCKIESGYHEQWCPERANEFFARKGLVKRTTDALSPRYVDDPLARVAPHAERPSFHEIFMKLAWLMNERSTCRRLKVGCVITSVDHRRVYAVGYNGNASGLANDCDRVGEAAVGSCGCFVGSTRVASRSVELAYRRWYEGRVVHIVTRYNDVTVTQNHPVLVLGRGWIAAELLAKGDHVVHAGGRELEPAVVPHDQDRVPIQDVFEALRVSGRLVRRAGARHQFHGDGSTEDVDIVGTDCGLSTYLKAVALHGVRQPSFAAAPQVLPLLGSDGTLSVFVTQRIELSRDPCSSFLVSQEPTLLKPESDGGAADVVSPGEPFGCFPRRVSSRDILGGQREHRLSLVSAKVLGILVQDTSFTKTVLDRRVRHTERVGEIENSLSSTVSADEVLYVERNRWSGHVYNLQTSSGWYTADNGMVAKNCLHAEENAVINCDVPRSYSKLVYATCLPCTMCAKRLINLGGVERVYYATDYRIRDSLALLKSVGIDVQKLGEEG